jgi:hypothetical protein
MYKRGRTWAVSALSTLVVLTMGVLGCNGSQAPPAPPKAQEERPDEWGVQGPQPAWWAERDPCPDGAELVGDVPPKQRVLECRLRDGRQHGFSSVWFGSGHEGTLTEYRNGVRHGRWLHWMHGRKLVEGRFQDGRRHGRWVYWFDEWSDFDTAGRMKPIQPVVVEVYNKGLLVSTTRAGEGSPEEMAPEEPHVQRAAP